MLDDLEKAGSTLKNTDLTVRLTALLGVCDTIQRGLDGLRQEIAEVIAQQHERNPEERQLRVIIDQALAIGAEPGSLQEKIITVLAKENKANKNVKVLSFKKKTVDKLAEITEAYKKRRQHQYHSLSRIPLVIIGVLFEEARSITMDEFIEKTGYKQVSINQNCNHVNEVLEGTGLRLLVSPSKELELVRVLKSDEIGSSKAE